MANWGISVGKRSTTSTLGSTTAVGAAGAVAGAVVIGPTASADSFVLKRFFESRASPTPAPVVVRNRRRVTRAFYFISSPCSVVTGACSLAPPTR
jgi:hypothetical protein